MWSSEYTTTRPVERLLEPATQERQGGQQQLAAQRRGKAGGFAAPADDDDENDDEEEEDDLLELVIQSDGLVDGGRDLAVGVGGLHGGGDHDRDAP